MQKPPIGIMPRKMWDEIRRTELVKAIARYNSANKPVPHEWVIEYLELAKSELEGQEWD
jgi:hypothetical protein